MEVKKQEAQKKLVAFMLPETELEALNSTAPGRQRGYLLRGLVQSYLKDQKTKKLIEAIDNIVPVESKVPVVEAMRLIRNGKTEELTQKLATKI